MYNSGVKKIVSGVLVLFLIAATLILGDTVYTSFFGGDTNNDTQTSAQLVTVQTTQAPATTQAPSTTAPSTTAAPAATTAPASDNQNQTTVANGEQTTATADTTENTAQASADVTAMSTEQIIALAGEAINKTKGYKDAITVRHIEAFDASVTECTGGSTIAGIVNSAMAGIVKPSDEVLNYSNGTATTGEGETIQLLLPKDGQNTLTVDGVESAKASKDGENTVIDIKLKPETSSLGQKPQYAASCAGYLDVSTISVPAVTLEKADTTYKGITMHIVVRPDGYVASAEYVLPIHLELGAKAAFINATAVIDATETETFEINW